MKNITINFNVETGNENLVNQITAILQAKGAINIQVEDKVVQKIPNHLIYSDLGNWNNNAKQLSELNKKAYHEKSLLGRILRFHCNDGYAFYQIVELCGLKCKVKLTEGVGDDYTINDIGEENYIDLSRANIYLWRLEGEC